MLASGHPVPEDYSERINTLTVAAYGSELKITPGMKEALEEITLPVCVASSSYPSKLKLGLETVGLYERFAPNIISGTSVARGKPEPDVFLFAAGWMRTSPMKCLVVEDSVAGVRSAVRAGMRVFGYTGGSHCGPEQGDRLREAGASVVFHDMRELPELLHTAA
jgi:HAD superfamily hydrolase (TIGR01509 family)